MRGFDNQKIPINWPSISIKKRVKQHFCPFFFGYSKNCLYLCSRFLPKAMGRHGGIGRHEGLKIPCPVMGVPVRPRLAVPHCSSSIKGAAFFVCSRKNLVPYFFPSMSTWIEICECAGTRGLGLNLAGVNKMNDNSLSTCICRKHHVRLWTTRVRVCDGNAMNVRWTCDAFLNCECKGTAFFAFGQ